MNNPNHRVLVAGAGLVGLVAANIFADAGVPVMVFEAEPALPTTLRASTFQPPTFDLLDRLGISQKVIALGMQAPRLYGRKPLSAIRIRTACAAIRRWPMSSARSARSRRST